MTLALTLFTLSGASPLAKLLMMARDCWNLEPPMPASAINWLTALITWVERNRGWGECCYEKHFTTRTMQKLSTCQYGVTNLQMWANYRLSLSKLKVFSHEKIQQGSSLCLGGAWSMVTALKDLIAQTATHVCLTLEECTGELQKEKKDATMHKRTMDSVYLMWCAHICVCLYDKPFVRRVLVKQRHAVGWRLTGWSERRASRCPAPSSSMHSVHRPATAASVDRMKKYRTYI